MESAGQMRQRHKLELRDLQNQTKALAKKLKKDNLSKKEIEQRVAEFEQATAARHALELQAIMQNLEVADEAAVPAPAPAREIIEDKSNAKLEKAQRKRDKKRQEERERQDRIAFESQNVVSQRQIESNEIAKQLNSLNLVVKEIPSDGHCMYHAVADQLNLTGRLASLKDAYLMLRQRTAAYMRAHSDDFLPFVELIYDSDVPIQDQFESYCKRVEETSDWGGQVELRALAQALLVPIEVYSASTAVIVMGDEFRSDDHAPLRLSYHLHYYTLGEHFNSVVLASGDEGDLK